MYHAIHTLWMHFDPWTMKGSCRSMAVVGRCSKSLIRHLATKWVNLGASGRADNGKTGGGSRGIWNKALIGCNPLSGGSPVANSMAVMPNDQTSHLLSYDESRCCSQAITWKINQAIYYNFYINTPKLLLIIRQHTRVTRGLYFIRK